MYTVITTADLAQRPKQSVARLTALAQRVSAHGAQLAIGHNHRGTAADQQLLAALAPLIASGAVAVDSGAFYAGDPCLGCLRNAALAQAPEDAAVVVVDPDAHPDMSLFDSMAEEVAEGAPLSAVPCLHLNEAGSRRVLEGAAAAALAEDFLARRNGGIEGIALVSAFVAAPVAAIRAIGGWHAEYTSASYGDWDFLMRLFAHCGLIGPRVGMLTDRHPSAPLLAEGFRAALAEHFLPALLDRRIALRLHYEEVAPATRRLDRDRNAAMFRQRMAAFDAPPALGAAPAPAWPLIPCLEALCRAHELPIGDFQALLSPGPPPAPSRDTDLIRRAKALLG